MQKASFDIPHSFISMASLSSMPTELTDFIFEDLSFADFRSLAKTSRSLCLAALPSLYQTIIISLTGLPGGRRIKYNNVKDLCRTLIERPDYARYIRTLELDSPFANYGIEISQAEQTLFANAIDARFRHLADRITWRAALLRTSSNFFAVLVLTLSHCLRLDKLEISSSEIPYDVWLRPLIQSATELQPFRQLSSLRITSYKAEGRCFMGTRAELFSGLPKLEVLQIQTGFPSRVEMRDRNRQAMGPVAPGTLTPLNLTKLSLLRSDVAISDVVQFLKQTPKLRTLNCDILYSAMHVPLDLRGLQTSLELIRNTLVHLAIRFDIHDSNEMSARQEMDLVRGDLTFIHDFPALTTLETSLALLFGQTNFAYSRRFSGYRATLATTLPPRLKTLIISDDLWTFTPFICTEGAMTMDVFKRFFTGEFLSRDWTYWTKRQNIEWENGGNAPWLTATPEPKEFQFDMQMKGRKSPDYWALRWTRDELRRACESQGIKCTIFHGSPGL